MEGCTTPSFMVVPEVVEVAAYIHPGVCCPLKNERARHTRLRLCAFALASDLTNDDDGGVRKDTAWDFSIGATSHECCVTATRRTTKPLVPLAHNTTSSAIYTGWYGTPAFTGSFFQYRGIISAASNRTILAKRRRCYQLLLVMMNEYHLSFAPVVSKDDCITSCY